MTGQADGRWKKDVLSLRCQLDIQEYTVSFTQVSSSEENLTPDYGFGSHQERDDIWNHEPGQRMQADKQKSPDQTLETLQHLEVGQKRRKQ